MVLYLLPSPDHAHTQNIAWPSPLSLPAPRIYSALAVNPVSESRRVSMDSHIFTQRCFDPSHQRSRKQCITWSGGEMSKILPRKQPISSALPEYMANFATNQIEPLHSPHKAVIPPNMNLYKTSSSRPYFRHQITDKIPIPICKQSGKYTHHSCAPSLSLSVSSTK